MNTQNDPAKNWKYHVKTALAKVKGNRLYALSEGQLLALAAFCKAYANRNGEPSHNFQDELVEACERLAKVVPGLQQERPGVAPVVPPIPVDPITGLACLNPFASGSKDIASRNAVELRYPELSKHLQRLAKDGGFSFAYAAEMADAEAGRVAANQIKYAEAEHARNPFRDRHNLQAQNEFVQTHSEEVVEYWRKEAEPVQLPWARGSINRTTLGKLLQADRELGETAMRASEVEGEWLSEYLGQAKAAQAAAAEQMADAQSKLKNAIIPTATRPDIGR